MPLYDYLCDVCGWRFEEVFSIHEPSAYVLCESCIEVGLSEPNSSTPRTLAAAPRATFPSYARKVIVSFPGIGYGLVREAHYNTAVGKMIQSDAQFKSELSRQSDEASERNGFPVSFAPIDHRESREHLGVTDEGLDSTYSEQVRQGKRNTVKHL